MNIWCFGPENTGSNMLLDKTKGLQYMKDIKDHMCTAFGNATKKGALIEEETRGIRTNIVDCHLHTDSAHRGDGQIIPAARRLFYACQLASVPTLYEPIFYCEINAPTQVLGGIYQVLSQRRG